MNALLWIATALIVLWLLAEVLGFVIGAALHLLWIAALGLLALWLFQKMRVRMEGASGRWQRGSQPCAG